MTVPIVAIHIAVFVGVYLLSWRFLRSTILDAEISVAGHFLDEGSTLFARLEPTRDPDRSRELIHALGQGHPGVRVVLFDSRGHPVAGRLATDDVRPRPALGRALRTGFPDTSWVVSEKPLPAITGIRLLREAESCHHCHVNQSRIRGAFLAQVPLGDSLAKAAGTLRLFTAGMAGLWMLLLAGMLRLQKRVIDRPLARIDRSFHELEPVTTNRPSDLDGLADAVSESVSRIADRRRSRDSQVATGMVRAEQLAALGEIAAGLSHEIRNPLAGIRTALEVLRKEEADAPRPERDAIHAQMISELDRVTRSLDALLRLARPRAPQRVPVDLPRLARNAAALFEPQARERRIELEQTTAPGLPAPLLDPDMMMQLLVNLLTNALQAVRDGGRIRIEIEAFAEGGGISLCVADDGAGISAEALERVFEPFFTTKPSGTGLGLAVCRQIVEQHGGRIELDSRPGGGTRVVANFPIREVA